MWIICQAEDLYEMSIHIFYENEIENKISSATNFAWRFKSSYYINALPKYNFYCITYNRHIIVASGIIGEHFNCCLRVLKSGEW